MRTLPGLVEWFAQGDHARVEQVLEDARRLGVRQLRAGVSWGDFQRDGGPEWADWLIRRLSQEVDVLPVLRPVAPRLGDGGPRVAPHVNGETYADFVRQVVMRHADLLDAVELAAFGGEAPDWERPDDERMPADVLVRAARIVSGAGLRVVLGVGPFDPRKLGMVLELVGVERVDAVTVSAFPEVEPGHWRGWQEWTGHVRAVLQRHFCDASIWVVTGASTAGVAEARQAESLLAATTAHVDRIYWYGVYDRVAASAADELHARYGLREASGEPKLLHRLWCDGGLDQVAHVVGLARRRRKARGRRRPALVTGGAGFIGTNLTNRLVGEGRPVIVYDSLARPGAERNLAWLVETHGDALDVRIHDVREARPLRQSVAEAAAVFHLAAQVAVTTSLDDPLSDFEVNVRGTLNLIEAAREMGTPPPLVFTSTNKVYGNLEDLQLSEGPTRYEPTDARIGARGVGEDRPLDFHSPYGCSKGAADQYVLDYARSYDLPAVVFRMSCIYGPHQYGNEDQGWVAHFLIRSLAQQPITIFGDGKQVRDALYVEDLADAFVRAVERIDRVRGKAFNIGGGPQNTVSLRELLTMLDELGHTTPIQHGDWRTGDQRYYVSDIRRFQRLTGWRPRVSVPKGVGLLLHWLAEGRRPDRKTVHSPKGEAHAHGHL